MIKKYPAFWFKEMKQQKQVRRNFYREVRYNTDIHLILFDKNRGMDVSYFN